VTKVAFFELVSAEPMRHVTGRLKSSPIISIERTWDHIAARSLIKDSKLVRAQGSGELRIIRTLNLDAQQTPILRPGERLETFLLKE
jgi:hypothetical protein